MKLNLFKNKAEKARLWHFHGGVHLPDEKQLSNGEPTRPAPLPAQVSIPLQQHIGAPAKPCVAVGDRVRAGQVIAEPQGYVSAPVHASISGVVSAIETQEVPHPSGLRAPVIVIDSDGEDLRAEPMAPIADPTADLTQVSPDELRARIREAGIVGLGGASFPAHVKLNPGKDQPIDTLVINGAECEPYISCDDLLMRERAEDIIAGVRVMLQTLGRPRCLIGIEDNKPEGIAAMRAALARQEGEGLVEAGKIQIRAIPTLYPSGGEKQMIRILTGREVPSHGIPAQIGIVCQNVGTAAAISDAVFSGRPLIERYVTVTGRAVARPRNYRVRIGTALQGLIDASEGFGETPAKLLIGGPMMGYRIDRLDVPLTKACNCVLALTEAESPDPGEPLACIRCGRCAEVCPANLLPQQLYWHARAKDLDKAQDYNLFDCIECGCCAHVCPSHIPLVQYYRFAKTEVWAREREKRAAEHARARHEAREARLQRLAKEKAEMLAKKKAAAAAKAAAAKAGAAAKTAPAAGGQPTAEAGIARSSAETGVEKSSAVTSASAAATASASDKADKQAAIAAARARAAAKKQAAQAGQTIAAQTTEESAE